MKKNASTVSKRQTPSSMKLIFIFLAIFISCGLFCVICGMATHGDSWKGMLFHNGPYTDWFMDFFNSIRDAAASNVYTERNNIYPPLAILFFRIIARILPSEISLTTFPERYMLQRDQLTIMTYIIYVIVLCIVLYRIVSKYAWNNGLKLSGEITAFAVVVSYPVLYCLERGNITIAAFALSMFFVFFRNSESRVVREIAYIMLACAAGIKYYPAIFGLLLLFDKKYKEAGKLVLYGILAFVLPLLALNVIKAPVQTSAEIVAQQKAEAAAEEEVHNDDFAEYAYSASDDEDEDAEKAAELEAKASSGASVLKILTNLSAFTGKKGGALNFSSVSVKNFFYFIPKIANSFEYYFLLHEDASLAPAAEKACNALRSVDWDDVAVKVCIVTEVLAFASLFILKKEWQKVFMLTYIFLNIAVLSSTYALMFVCIPMLMMIMGNKKHRRKEIAYTVLFALLVSSVPTFWCSVDAGPMYFATTVLKMSYNSKFNQLIATPVYQTMFIMVLADTVRTLKIRIRKRSDAKYSTAKQIQTVGKE